MKNKTIKITALILSIIMIASSISLTACQLNINFGTTTNNGANNPDVPGEAVVDPIDDNYRTFYQIFVGSFSDANNDGIGDLQGIINRMDYLNDGDINSGNDLGVQGIWLSPIFSSPSYHKYDAKDYYSIDWRFGNEDILKNLIDLCHERNVKIILDLVLNHTSDQHPWFQEFKKARMAKDTSSKYYNFYSCVKAADKKGGVTYQQIPTVDCWYECNFSGGMPELNYDNADVREAMLDVARYYLNMGIDGFRFDAIKYIYFDSHTRSAAFWEWYMGVLREEYPDIYAIGECWSGDSDVIKYYGSMNCFNFTMSSAEGKIALAAKGNSNISGFTTYVVSHLNSIKGKNPDAMMIPFLSNHDQDRIAGAFITENNTKMAANLYLLCSGSPVIYYGEEIGIRGKRGDELTDANRRLAMLWGDGDFVRDPLGSCYPTEHQIKTTVASQLEDPNSIRNHYARVIAIRHKYPAIARGDYSTISSSNKNFGGFLVSYEGEKLGILHNTSSSAISVDLSKCSGLNGHTFTQLCDFVGSGNATLTGTTLTIGAYTSVILK